MDIGLDRNGDGPRVTLIAAWESGRLLHNVLLAGFGPILYFQKCPGQHAKVASHQIFRDFPGHGTLKEIP